MSRCFATLSGLDAHYLQRCGGLRHGIPGLSALTRKDLLALTVQRAKKTRHADQFAFVPESYVFPNQAARWRSENRSSSVQWIVKPPAESCGEGISVESCDGVEAAVERLREAGESSVCVSQYISNPRLLHKHKWDVRLYAVVLWEAGKLTPFLHREGLVRFATTPYDLSEAPGAQLTNYSLNVEENEFREAVGKNDSDKNATVNTADELDAHKWSLERLLLNLEPPNNLEPDSSLSSPFLSEAAGILARAVAVALPDVQERASKDDSCYELVGVDLLLDEKNKLHLLEVQNRPSLLPSSELDRTVKESVVNSVHRLLGPQRDTSAWVACEWADSEASSVAVASHRDAEDDQLRQELHRTGENISYEAALLYASVSGVNFQKKDSVFYGLATPARVSIKESLKLFASIQLQLSIARKGARPSGGLSFEDACTQSLNHNSSTTSTTRTTRTTTTTTKNFLIKCFAGLLLARKDLHASHLSNIIAGSLFDQVTGHQNVVCYHLLENLKAAIHFLNVSSLSVPTLESLHDKIGTHSRRSAALNLSNFRRTILAKDSPSSLPRVFFCSAKWLRPTCSSTPPIDPLSEHDFAVVKHSNSSYQLISGYNSLDGWQHSDNEFSDRQGFDKEVCESLLDRLGLFANGRKFEAENWFRLFHARVPQTNDAVWPSFSVQELQDSAIRGEGERQHAEEIEHLMRQRNDNILSDDI
ncbi:hypothetical protein TrVE_jg3710 [Triparma verrucosa]|uniref:Tubulin--tyrosine ligase-like protein 5 n=1 Tax=Triparma verrucosa TaxID=1606542 RepID=A0A9W7EZI5_9STRA|nr:hypothetical protein TrVE_jg3710 [Triparma verrucosa]